MPTDMLMSNTDLGAVKTGSSTYSNSSKTKSTTYEKSFIDGDYRTSTDNTELQSPERVTNKRNSDFNSTLEEQIRKQPPKDETVDNEQIVDNKGSSTANEVEQGNTETPVNSVKSSDQTNETSNATTDEVKGDNIQTVSCDNTVDISLTSEQVQNTAPSNSSIVQTETVTQGTQEQLSQVATQAGNPQVAMDSGEQQKSPENPVQNNEQVAKVTSGSINDVNVQIPKDNNPVTDQTNETSQNAVGNTGKSEIAPDISNGSQNSAPVAAQNTSHESKENVIQGEKVQTFGDDQLDSKGKKETSALPENRVNEIEQSESKPTSTGEYPAAQKLAANDAQVSSQFKSSTNTDAKDKTNIDSEQVIPHNNVQNQSANPSPSITQVGKSVDNSGLPTTNSTNIAEQIQESFSAGVKQGNQQITIRLNPPELGSVKISINEQDNKITGVLEVSELQTRAEIQQTLPQIVRNLQEMGIQVKRLDVTLSSQQEDGSSMGHSLTGHGNNYSGGEGSGNSGNRSDNSDWYGPADWLSENNRYLDGGLAYKQFFTESAINMLA